MQVEEKQQIYCTLTQALHTAVGGWDSTVDVVNVPRAGCPRDQIPFKMSFSVPVQTRSKVHPTSRTTSTRRFTGGDAERRGVGRPPPSSAEVTNGLRLNVCLPSVSAYSCNGDDLYLHT